MMPRYCLNVCMGVLLSLSFGLSLAQTATYFGEDINGGAAPKTFARSLAARDAFLSAIGRSATEGFESMATGDGYVAGARTPIAAVLGGANAIIEVDMAQAEVWRYAIGGRYPFAGENYLLFVGNPLRQSFLDITFTRPVGAFGFSAVDAGDFAERLSLTATLVDGSRQTIGIPHVFDDPAANASAFFFGIQTAAAISGVRIENEPLSNGTPFIAFDEFVVQPPSAPNIIHLPNIPAVPEAPASAMLFAGWMIVMIARRRDWRRQA